MCQSPAQTNLARKHVVRGGGGGGGGGGGRKTNGRARRWRCGCWGDTERGAHLVRVRSVLLPRDIQIGHDGVLLIPPLVVVLAQLILTCGRVGVQARVVNCLKTNCPHSGQKSGRSGRKLQHRVRWVATSAQHGRSGGRVGRQTGPTHSVLFEVDLHLLLELKKDIRS